MSVYNTPQRPRTREDGWPTRADIRYDTDAERLCRVLVGLVEGMGASASLTRAVTLLADARDAIADHVERVEPAPQPEPLEERVEYGHQTLEWGWVPEHRGIKYARQQRTVHLRAGAPVDIDHWTYADHRHPVEGCTFCADLAARGAQPRTTNAAVSAALLLAAPQARRYDQCNGTCTVDCGHCKGRGAPEQPR